jgi:hypothetical protein
VVANGAPGEILADGALLRAVNLVADHAHGHGHGRSIHSHAHGRDHHREARAG